MFQILISLLGLLLLGLDQWSKQWATASLQGQGTVPVIPGLFDFCYLPHGNTGAAWGLFSGNWVMLILLPVLMVIAIIVLLIVKRNMHKMAFFSLVLVVVGGIGNLIDRVKQGAVVDFIRFAFWDSFPTFNVADIVICIGVGFMMLYILFIDGKEEKKNAAD